MSSYNHLPRGQDGDSSSARLLCVSCHVTLDHDSLVISHRKRIPLATFSICIVFALTLYHWRSNVQRMNQISYAFANVLKKNSCANEQELMEIGVIH